MLSLVVPYRGTGRICCKGCGTGLLELQKTGNGGSGYCSGCDTASAARAVVGLAPVVSRRCCDLAENCTCGGMSCRVHGTKHVEGRTHD